MNEVSSHINSDMWVISSGEIPDYNNIDICGEVFEGPVKEYEISELGYYLLNPKLIEVLDVVIGFEVTYKDSFFNAFKKNFRKVLPFFFKKLVKTNESEKEKFVNYQNSRQYNFSDMRLKNHLNNLNSQLRPHDPICKKIKKLDLESITDIKAVCEDPGGNAYSLILNGTLSEKSQYILDNLYHDVKVSLNRSYLTNGIFEMRGFNFSKFNPDQKYKLLKLGHNGDAKCCVFDKNDKFQFWVENDTKLAYPILLEHSLRADNELQKSIAECMNEKAVAYKFFFTKKIEFQYTNMYLPKIFRQNLNSINLKQKGNFAEILNSFQRVVSFSKLTDNDEGERGLYTNISVMHDLRALDDVKQYIPDLYTQIEQETPLTDAGKLYLLDSMSGFSNNKL
ncbi:MAG: hypothetical protein GY714_13150 [Desulfobacterales bacterium]|nr:hypothetical protein [Desulfobacterales bacterium]MCP4158590.1 hypothetical protein [Deltaproteobacteria bacterium]